MRRALAALVLCASAAHAQTIYRWTDKQGEAHYTDDLSSVPRGVKAVPTGGDELMIVPALPPAPVQAALPPTPTRPAATRPGPVEVRLTKVTIDLLEVDRRYIEESVRTAAASPRLASWGGLQQSVEVEVAAAETMSASHGGGAFGLAIGTTRALVRAPKDTRSWGRALDYPGCVLHELAHLLEHQVASDERPRWFAEGFASFVSDDSHGMAATDIAWWVIHEGGPRPLDAIFGAQPAEVHLAYAIARDAVRYLVELVGQPGVLRMFSLRHEGRRFESAFKQVTGLEVGEFQRKYTESLRPNYYERAR